MKRTDSKSNCPINYTLEILGDAWTLLVVRDLVFYGKHTFGEFMAADERIPSNTLTDRLHKLCAQKILYKSPHPSDKRKEYYGLTAKGLELVPLLVELANWGVRHNSKTPVRQAWVEQVRTDRSYLVRLIEITVKRGGAVFTGENSVMDQLNRVHGVK